MDKNNKPWDPKPWVSATGFRTAVQAWHPVHGLSQFRPRSPESLLARAKAFGADRG